MKERVFVFNWIKVTKSLEFITDEQVTCIFVVDTLFMSPGQ